MKKYSLHIISFFAVFWISVRTINAQMKNGTNPDNLNASEIKASNNGLLVPSVYRTSTIFSDPLGSHVEVMRIYSSANSGNIVPGFYYSDGSKWVGIFSTDDAETGALPVIGDLKQSFRTNDYNGRCTLEGRTLSSLSASAQAMADSIAITGNLPDAKNGVLKTGT
ncbi:hypothetical protein SAMN04515674_1073 [Pseudarcicella hirudinis]|uniref:Uncharacterized protein n=1 Tax=Pseudarcicella hirudinis TaxID=1079859 RepID=A0A1I5U5D5_9BACT|nr:hypothetical protein [Pseudarcicella hirudinis]SFP90505.1 hypothetical protein SAMN04515674_1073 [Pseudarcicella hirudinis]